MTADRVIVGFVDDHHWSASFGMSLRDMYLRDISAECRIIRAGGVELRKVAGTMGVADGRNELVAEFLDRTDGDWLFMVDTDMGFDPDTVDRLIASADPVERPVVGGLCFALRHSGSGPQRSETFGIVPTVYAWEDLPDESGFMPLPDYPRDTIFQAGGTGAACLLIHRRALATIRKAQGDVWFDPIKHPTAAGGKPRGFSEDLSFCVRLAAAGIPLHVDSRVKTSHHKGPLFLTERMFLDQQARAVNRELVPE